jgi:hypothetical protein
MEGRENRAPTRHHIHAARSSKQQSMQHSKAQSAMQSKRCKKKEI